MKIVYTALKEVRHTKLGRLTCGKVCEVSNTDGREYLKSDIFVSLADWETKQAEVKDAPGTTKKSKGGKK